jgi:hypothetical protein
MGIDEGKPWTNYRLEMRVSTYSLKIKTLMNWNYLKLDKIAACFQYIQLLFQ